VVTLVLIIGIGSVAGRRAGLTGIAGDGIARVTISGAIGNNLKRVEALEQLAKSNYKAVIVHVSSPGGTVSGAEQLYDALVRLKASKPLVVVVDSLAASGGYIVALASDHIIAQQGSLVGSIGVLFQYPDVTELMKTLGVKVEAIRSTSLKAMPNPFEPTSPEARAAIDAIVKDSYNWFRGLVAERRNLSGTALDAVADGRVFTGRQALELKLVDALGNEQTAREWLAKEKNIALSTPVRDYSLQRFAPLGDLPFIRVAAVGLFDALGLTSFARRLEESGTMRAIERLNLDGLLALWHPPASN
jgi:protease-4